MAQRIPGDGKVTVDDLVVQTAMAFGQGAELLNVSPRASRLLLSYFKPRFEHHLDHYRQHVLGMLAYARGLGWYAATLANSKGRAIIDAVDVKVAIDKMPCPFMPEIIQFLEQLGKPGRG